MIGIEIGTAIGIEIGTAIGTEITIESQTIFVVL
jgi:hypothetical protein